MQNYNKHIIFASIFIFAVCLIFLTVLGPIKAKVSEHIGELTSEEYEKKIQDRETFILYLYADSCKYCEKFEPVLDKSLGELNLDAYKIQNDKNDDYRNLIKSKLGERFQGTPAVYFYVGGEVKEYLVGTQDISIVKKYLEAYLKESK